MLSYLGDIDSDAVRSFCSSLRKERFLFDLSESADLQILRGDVRRIAAAMDDPDQPPPMFWSGIPLPAGRSSGNSEYCLMISVGGTNLNYLVIRLRDHEVVGLDSSGKEVSGDELVRLKKACRMKSPTKKDVPHGHAMIELVVRNMVSYLEPLKEKLRHCPHILLSWGFPHRVVRTNERVLGGLTAIITLMTKDQAPFTDELRGEDVGRLFSEALQRQLGWSRPVTVANDTVMALHYFLSAENRERYSQIGLFINGTGSNFSIAEPYSVRPAGVVSRDGEQYEPTRISKDSDPLPGESREFYMVNYEHGSIELEATRTRFDLSEDYPIESNALAGGNAFEQQFRELVTDALGKEVFDRIVEGAARGPLETRVVRGPEVTRVAAGQPADVDDLFPGAALDKAQRETVWAVGRLVMARSALHAALVLAAITHRTDFGLGGKEGRSDLLGMEGSVWKSPGYADLVRKYWQSLVGEKPLRIDFLAEKNYDASSAGPLYLTALQE